ncbi:MULTISPECIES: DUF485 domain-containing protein [Brachybacterium]|uniref:DUF485 domain-containing protein n=2 Tax=Brachybacterium TaxID=43668 RepID=A0A426SIS5_9MICO|nr:MULTISPECIES: DUF485 domain-containing protein [Brachybacterium]MCT1437974.1 DUF485 domain-containing protein [Brachybacterium paraconglomeratum]MDV3295847.1 DUF485 domain-containing protein [Brachybacterium paraconglomeratum]RRR18053.1 DUF485 domain-containing protein [Brachybacterium paraconglomeratum]TDP77874.1 uncharacterized membrane protein (DUF485 family) [Brachybacterium sp. AG952]GLI29297.1 hypothetical protein BCONGLO52_01380 [Brachybacterium conglomeratum]
MTTPPPAASGPSPEPGLSPDRGPASPPGAAPSPTPEQFQAVQKSEEFGRLRSSFRSFAIPMTVAFLVWYFAYVLLSTYAEGLMSTPVLGNLNLGLLMGISQFLMTFLITWLYIRHANRNLDPIAEKLRDELEGEH